MNETIYGHLMFMNEMENGEPIMGLEKWENKPFGKVVAVYGVWARFWSESEFLGAKFCMRTRFRFLFCYIPERWTVVFST